MATENKGIFRQHNDFWVEKYRPQTLEDYLGNSTIKEKFQSFIDNGLTGNIMLSGAPGCGKSTVAHIFAKKLGLDFKYINASDESGIETIRTKVSSFCVTSGFTAQKILILDEGSGISQTGQLALKAVIEQHSKNTKFILTCNDIEDINPAIISRFQHFEMIAPDKHQVKKLALKILDAEKVEYDDEEVDSIIDFNYPDLRLIINDLQKQTINKVLKLDKEYFKLLTYKTRVVELLKGVTKTNQFDKVNEVRQIIADCRIKKFNLLYSHLFANLDSYCKQPEDKIPVIIIIGKYSYQDKDAPDKEINLIAGLVEIVEILGK